MFCLLELLEAARPFLAVFPLFALGIFRSPFLPQALAHRVKVVLAYRMLFHVNMTFSECHAFYLQLLPLDAASAKGKAAGTKALGVYDAVAGRYGIAWIFVQRVSHIAAQVAVSKQSCHLRIRGHLSLGNQANRGVYFLREILLRHGGIVLRGGESFKGIFFLDNVPL